MKTPRIDIGTIRRQQIVEAAVAIIAEQGLQNLSLSQIEKKAGMSRGQLTYYFPSLPRKISSWRFLIGFCS